MKKYETILIFDPALSDAEVGQEIGKIKTLVSSLGGSEVSLDQWGKREIAYIMKKRKLGNYVVIYYATEEPDLVEKLNNQLRITESVVKFQTHRIQEHVRKFKGRIQTESEDDYEDRVA